MALLQPKVNYLTNKELLREIHPAQKFFVGKIVHFGL